MKMSFAEMKVLLLVNPTLVLDTPAAMMLFLGVVQDNK
jgi:hypothetical protein